MTEQNSSRKFKKRYIWPILLILLIAIRLALPTIVTKYVNKNLSNLDGYTGSISDVDLFLYRGAYQICDLRVEVVHNEIKEPFVDIPLIDLSVEWKSIFKGAIVGEVEIYDPMINFAFGPTEAQSQTGETVDWVQIVQDLMPININRFEVVNGDINLMNVSTSPDISARFQDLDLEILNIRNVETKAVELPSDITLTGRSSFGGEIVFNAKADLIKEFPDFNYDARIEGVDLTKFNAISKEMAGVTIEKGVLDVYSEMVGKNKKLEGYVKPLLHDVSIFSWKEKDRTFGEAIKELFVEAGQELVENRKGWDELTATRVPISGNIDAPSTEVWSTIVNLLVNAYIDRFKGVLDGSIEWNDTTNQLNDEVDDEQAKDEKKKDKKRKKKKD